MPPMKVDKAQLTEKIRVFLQDKYKELKEMKAQDAAYEKDSKVLEQARDGYVRKVLKEQMLNAKKVRTDFRVIHGFGNVTLKAEASLVPKTVPKALLKEIKHPVAWELENVQHDIDQAAKELDLLSIVTTDTVNITSDTMFPQLSSYMHYTPKYS